MRKKKMNLYEEADLSLTKSLRYLDKEILDVTEGYNIKMMLLTNQKTNLENAISILCGSEKAYVIVRQDFAAVKIISGSTTFVSITKDIIDGNCFARSEIGIIPKGFVCYKVENLTLHIYLANYDTSD